MIVHRLYAPGQVSQTEKYPDQRSGEVVEFPSYVDPETVFIQKEYWELRIAEKLSPMRECMERRYAQHAQ